MMSSPRLAGEQHTEIAAPLYYDDKVIYAARAAFSLQGEAGNERVICAISRAALEDHFGADGS
jgi:hypothetical protein